MLLQVAVSDVPVLATVHMELYLISVGDDAGEMGDYESWNTRTQIGMQNGSVKVKSLSIGTSHYVPC